MHGESGKNYSDLKRLIKHLADKSMYITQPDGSEVLVRWIEKPTFHKGSGLVEIRLDRDMAPFLLHLKSGFTRYQLYHILRMRSKYSVRLYELICSIHYNTLEEYMAEFTLDELRKRLDAENYTTYQTLKARVLLPAVEEINKYSDKNIVAEPIKCGHSVIGMRLKISDKPVAEKIKVEALINKELDNK